MTGLPEIRITSGEWLAANTLANKLVEHHLTGRVIAKCDAGRGQFRIDGSEAAYNAHVIATVPRMIEALRPFAGLAHELNALAERYDAKFGDGYPVQVKLGDLRAALDAWRQAAGEDGK